MINLKSILCTVLTIIVAIASIFLLPLAIIIIGIGLLLLAYKALFTEIKWR